LNRSLVQATSIALAFTVVLGAWLLFEYGERTNQFGNAEPRSTEQPSSQPRDIDSDQSPPHSAPGTAHYPADISESRSTSLIYKCKGPNGMAYRDRHCLPNETQLEVTAAGPISAPKSNLVQLKAMADAMEASRLRRDAAQNLETQHAANSAVDSKKLQCNLIDQRIAAVDSQLRQLHSAASGDLWTAERRKLTDSRFSLGC
jgi:hypothetical protein